MTEVYPVAPEEHTKSKPRPVSECIRIALLLPMKRPRRFIAIFCLPTILLFAITYKFPTANLLGTVFPNAGIGFGGPIVAAANYGLVGVGVWLGSAILFCFAMTAWSLEVTIGHRLSLATVLQLSIGRTPHYFAGSLLTYVGPMMPFLLLVVAARALGMPAHITVTHDQGAWPVVAVLIAVGLAYVWVILRAIFLAVLIALHGWRDAFRNAWKESRGLIPRLMSFIALTGMIVFCLNLTIIKILMPGESTGNVPGALMGDQSRLFIQTNFLNLGSVLVFEVLLAGFLAAHLPPDRFLEFKAPPEA